METQVEQMKIEARRKLIEQVVDHQMTVVMMMMMTGGS